MLAPAERSSQHSPNQLYLHYAAHWLHLHSFTRHYWCCSGSIPQWQKRRSCPTPKAGEASQTSQSTSHQQPSGPFEHLAALNILKAHHISQNYCSSGSPYCCSPSENQGTTCQLSTTQCNTVAICCNNVQGGNAPSVSVPARQRNFWMMHCIIARATHRLHQSQICVTP